MDAGRQGAKGRHRLENGLLELRVWRYGQAGICLLCREFSKSLDYQAEDVWLLLKGDECTYACSVLCWKMGSVIEGAREAK